MDGKRLKFALTKFLSVNWLVLVFILVFFLRLPSLFEPFTYGDEGIYLTLGQALRKGLVWYRDIHDNKPPMLYLLATLAGDFSTYRLILFFWSLATIFVFYKLSQLLFSKNQKATIISTTAFAILTSIHTFEGNVGNAENFMLLPIIGGVLVILRSLDISGLRRIRPSGVNKSLSVRRADSHRFSLFIFAGFLFGLATLFKVPAAFDFTAALVFVFLATEIRNLKLEIRNYSLLLLGFLLPILLTIIYYGFMGALGQYLTAAFFQNIPYLASWIGDKPQVGGLPLSLLGRGFLVLGLIGGLYILRIKISLAAKLILVWFAFSWFAALLSSRPYPHYLIQVLPPLSLSLGLFFTQQKKNLKERTLDVQKLIPTSLIIILMVSWIVFHFWHYPNLSYYANFYSYTLGQKEKEEYFDYFGKGANEIYQIATFISKHTLPEERIFIWGNQPSVYALSRRLPVGRYTVAYHIIDFNGYNQTMARLEMEPPRYLILMTSEPRPFPELFSFVAQNYALEKTIGEAQIFHQAIQ